MKVCINLKSHFKIKQQSNNKIGDNKIKLVKGLTYFILFSSIFFKNCETSLMFKKEKKNQISLLKAPSRHKKFFHQISVDSYSIKIFFNFTKRFNICSNKSVAFFNGLVGFFLIFGSNTITLTKVSLISKTKPTGLVLL